MLGIIGIFPRHNRPGPIFAEGTYRVWNRPPEFRIPWNLVSGFRIPRPYKFTKYTVNLSLFLFLFSEGSLGVSKSLNHLQDLSFAIFVLELAPEF